MRYKNLESYSTEELKDLWDTLNMSRCRRLFPYETHKQYYDDIVADLNEIARILKSRNKS